MVESYEPPVLSFVFARFCCLCAGPSLLEHGLDAGTEREVHRGDDGGTHAHAAARGRARLRLDGHALCELAFARHAQRLVGRAAGGLAAPAGRQRLHVAGVRHAVPAA